MHNFYNWFSIGVSHILNWEAYDHVLFLFALCCMYTFSQWKNVLILITAFTIGHSLSLLLSVMHVFVVNTKWVEFSIAVTILATCLYNIKMRSGITATGKSIVAGAGSYLVVCVFGFVHGLGFAGVLKDMLSGSDLLFPLFSFNTGIEVGQLIVVVTLLVISNFVISVCKIRQKHLVGVVSTVVAGLAIIIALGRLTDIFRH